MLSYVFFLFNYLFVCSFCFVFMSCSSYPQEYVALALSSVVVVVGGGGAVIVVVLLLLLLLVRRFILRCYVASAAFSASLPFSLAIVKTTYS